MFGIASDTARNQARRRVIAARTLRQFIDIRIERKTEMRKFTFAEVTKLCGRLQLFALSYLCEVCDRKRQAEMSVITTTGVPIYVCLTCATDLVQVSNAHRIATQNQLTLKSGTKKEANGTNGAHATKKRGRPRKAAAR